MTEVVLLFIDHILSVMLGTHQIDNPPPRFLLFICCHYFSGSVLAIECLSLRIQCVSQ